MKNCEVIDEGFKTRQDIAAKEDLFVNSTGMMFRTDARTERRSRV